MTTKKLHKSPKIARTLKSVFIQQILGTLAQRHQWNQMDLLTLAGDSERHLRALVEVGEITLCGSVGGFDTVVGQHLDNEGPTPSLVERALHVIRQKDRL